MPHIKDPQNEEMQEETLPSDRCPVPVWKRTWFIVFFAVILFLIAAGIVVACICSSSLSTDSEKTAQAQTASSASDREISESALCRMFRKEQAYVKTQKTLTAEVVRRYRHIRLELPAVLSVDERAVYEQYLAAYGTLRIASELADTELLLDRYEHAADDLKQAEEAERKRHRRLLSVPSKPRPEKKAVKVTKKTAPGSSKRANDKANLKYLRQLQRELNLVYREVYKLTSRMITVSHIKYSNHYASEFARGVKLLETWRAKKAQDPRLKKTPHLLPVWQDFDKNTVKRTIRLLKHCQTIHELTYKGGEKMKEIRVGHIRILSTNWKGIDFYDMQEKFEARLKITDLNSKLKRVLVMEGAKRCGKAELIFDKLPILAYYYVLAGNAENISAMKLELGEQQRLIKWSKNWGLPQKEQMFLQARPIK